MAKEKKESDDDKQRRWLAQRAQIKRLAKQIQEKAAKEQRDRQRDRGFSDKKDKP